MSERRENKQEGWKEKREGTREGVKEERNDREKQHGLPFKTHSRGFPDGPWVKNPPASAGDTGLIPGPGRSHVPWSH